LLSLSLREFDACLKLPERDEWIKIKNAKFSQLERREELFEQA
jgi:hypothetical protein